MTLPVVWSDVAEADLADIIDYIAEHSPQAARKLARQLKESVLPLADFPYMFKESERMPGCREIVAHPNYLVFYRILSDRIRIEMVAHGRRNFPIIR